MNETTPGTKQEEKIMTTKGVTLDVVLQHMKKTATLSRFMSLLTGIGTTAGA